MDLAFFQDIDSEKFLPNSYTTFKNKVVSTMDGKVEYLKECMDVVLVWPKRIVCSSGIPNRFYCVLTRYEKN